jgi:adenosylcobinamide kinase / adenosylcobinamide-phosphate guanylyltransferase
MRRTLVLGGARSGKSALAEGLLAEDRPATYVATGRRDPYDPEWSARIAEHIARRPLAWSTMEPTNLAAVLVEARPDDPPLLVDDLATWLTTVLDETGGWDGDLTSARNQCTQLIVAVRICRAELVLVSAEVGLGVIPSTRSGRLFRDELGALNAAVADHCTDVVLVVAGQALHLKPGR